MIYYKQKEIYYNVLKILNIYWNFIEILRK